MASAEPTDGRCNDPAWLNEAEREDPDAGKSGYCDSYPVEGASTCRMHFGTADRDGIRGAPEGNGNGITHGATASPVNLLNHLDDDELGWIQALVDGYIQVAPFDAADPRVERLTIAAVKIFQEWRGEEQILEDGMSENTVVAVNDRGEPVIDTDEHHLARFTSRLSKDVRHILKDLGVMPSSTNDAGTVSARSAAEILKAATERAND